MLQFIINALPHSIALWLVHRKWMQRFAFHVVCQPVDPDRTTCCRCRMCGTVTLQHMWEMDDSWEFHCLTCDAAWLEFNDGGQVLSLGPINDLIH